MLPRWQELSSQAWPGWQAHPAVGLVNLGNTCYFNSVLQVLGAHLMCSGCDVLSFQALYHTYIFRELVLGATIPPDSSPLLSSLQLLFQSLQQSAGATLSPSDFLTLSRPPWFLAGEQQDCSEYLTALLDGLQEEDNRPGEEGEEKSASVVREIFGGQMETCRECLSCHGSSTSTDWFTDLHVPIPSGQEEICVSEVSQLQHLPTITVTRSMARARPLQDLLASSLAPERLEGANQYQCDTCGGLRDAQKTASIVSAPKVLLLVLLRFEYDKESQSRRKLSTVVEYPDLLEVEVAGGQVEYRLQTVVVHSGGDSQEGHYYTWARQQVLPSLLSLLPFPRTTAGWC